MLAITQLSPASSRFTLLPKTGSDQAICGTLSCRRATGLEIICACGVLWDTTACLFNKALGEKYDSALREQ